jgi:hypothetical protein
MDELKLNLSLRKIEVIIRAMERGPGEEAPPDDEREEEEIIAWLRWRLRRAVGRLAADTRD